MNTKPKVSVIVPAYNCEKTIKNTLLSVLNQSFNDFEIIVIDNNSTDNTVKNIQSVKDDRIRLLSCSLRGPAAARNCGLKNAKSDIIAFLDADDLWEKINLRLVSQH